MQNCRVEIHGLSVAVACNGKRGTIVERVGERAVVDVNGGRILTKITNLCSVFCLGLPRECRVAVCADNIENALARALDDNDCAKFYLLYLGETTNDGTWQHFVRVRLPFFQMAMERMSEVDREPLLCVYLVNRSQNDPNAKIVFGDTMSNVDVAPAFVDLSSEQMETLAAREWIAPSNLQEQNLSEELKRLRGAREPADSSLG